MTQKTWLITGSGNGLGRNIAEAALKAGDNVVAGARRTEELASLVAQYGERVKPVTLEVRDESVAKAAVGLAVDTFGRLDVLVNNAGVYEFASLDQTTEEQFHRMFGTNVLGLILATREAAKHFGADGGSVINIGSAASSITPPNTVVYTATKGAVDAFGRLDVLVNNAGYGQFAPFEQMSAEDFQAIVDTCFYGVVYTTRAAVPWMRKQKSGHIFQVSSVGGRIAYGGNSPYHAAKWAVGGFSDALAMEVAPFGVKVCTLEPGGIRTNWARRAGQNAPDLLPEYEASVGSILKLLRSLE